MGNQNNNFEANVPQFNMDKIMSEVESIRSSEPVHPEPIINPEPVNFETPVVDIPKTPQPQIFSSVYAPEPPKEEVSVPTKEELDIELPSLKKDEPDMNQEIEMPALNNVTGETYNINH